MDAYGCYIRQWASNTLTQKTVRTNIIINHSWCSCRMSFSSASQTNQQISKYLVQILTKKTCIKPHQRQGSPYKTHNFGVQVLNKRRHAPPKETHLFLVDFAVISPVAPMASSINHPIELREPPVAVLSPNLVRGNTGWTLPPTKKRVFRHSFKISTHLHLQVFWLRFSWEGCCCRSIVVFAVWRFLWLLSA